MVVSMALAACAPQATPMAEPTKAEQPAEPTKAAEQPAEPTKAAEQPAEPTKAAEQPASPTEAPAEPAQQGMLPEVDPASLSGSIYAAGSSTVYPLAEAIAEEFKADGFTGEIKIDSIGSGGGFERFCKTGESDISNASRKIKDSEVENCGKLSPARTPIEFRVGTDAIAVVVSKDNDFVTDVTLEELAAIFSTAEKWSDVRPEWPAEPIQRFVPGTDSGTFDFFVEEVIQKPQKIEKLDAAKEIVLAAKNQQASEDDNVLVQGVLGSPYAVGYFGFAYYKNEEANLKALSINGIAPTFESAESGEYKLSRPLFIYSDAGIMKAKPQVAGFISYFLTNVNTVIEDVGYFPASEAALKEAMQKWLDAMK
ncbi:MAG: phosphate ABC transporter substrate-binding protein PstS family protein [Anaerolineae bacterium]|nr:phosphate ABC transporter substrate-binding protein PstS family protein [Anaerolineae bacterium]